MKPDDPVNFDYRSAQAIGHTVEAVGAGQFNQLWHRRPRPQPPGTNKGGGDNTGVFLILATVDELVLDWDLQNPLSEPPSSVIPAYGLIDSVELLPSGTLSTGSSWVQGDSYHVINFSRSKLARGVILPGTKTTLEVGGGGDPEPAVIIYNWGQHALPGHLKDEPQGVFHREGDDRYELGRGDCLLPVLP